jgi:hypothetical protein
LWSAAATSLEADEGYGGQNGLLGGTRTARIVGKVWGGGVFGGGL